MVQSNFSFYTFESFVAALGLAASLTLTLASTLEIRNTDVPDPKFQLCTKIISSPGCIDIPIVRIPRRLNTEKRRTAQVHNASRHV
ncbi:hypothetical protein CPC08DRAFT_767511 [Agrocybe pediades]|nr:hypothetical protein CPC08DRAFT_767511 [Agrocybe pediades]